MATIKRFEDLKAWQAARALNDAVSKLTLTGNLWNQIERSADSSMSNIVEGFDAGSDAEFLRFLKMAKRSASEFQSHLYVARDSGRMVQATFDALYEKARETKSLIGGLIRYLESCVAASSRLPRGKRRRKVRR